MRRATSALVKRCCRLAPAVGHSTVTRTVNSSTERCFSSGSSSEAQDRDAEQQQQQTFFELRRYEVRPDYQQMTRYFEVMERITAAKRKHATLFGAWRVVVGDTSEVIDIWEWKSFAARKRMRDELGRSEEFQELLKEAMPLLSRQRNMFINAFPFWPDVSATRQQMKPDGIYELREYTLKPGKVYEWAQSWEASLYCRAQYIKPIGAWYSELGPLNRVMHLWHFEHLDQRKELRELAWQEDGWRDNLARTLPLIEDMNASIMKAAPFSPLP